MEKRLSKEQRDEFEAITRVLVKWLNDNMHPHSHITVTTTTAELSEGVTAFQTYDYVKD